MSNPKALILGDRPLRFLAVGHLTNDVITQHAAHATSHAPGGSALYAVLTAKGLGHRSSVWTSIGDDFAGHDGLQQLGGIFQNDPAQLTTTFENTYVDGYRKQIVHSKAKALNLSELENHTTAANQDVTFLCPVIGELQGQLNQKSEHTLIGAGLQGWLRQLNDDGSVRRKVPTRFEFLKHVDVVFASDEDLGDEREGLASTLRDVVPTVVITYGKRGATVFENGTTYNVDVWDTEEIDPTGAGDVFASAFLLSRAQRMGIENQLSFAACAASVVVEAVGPGALGRISQAYERFGLNRLHPRRGHAQMSKPAADQSAGEL